MIFNIRSVSGIQQRGGVRRLYKLRSDPHLTLHYFKTLVLKRDLMLLKGTCVYIHVTQNIKWILAIAMHVVSFWYVSGAGFVWYIYVWYMSPFCPLLSWAAPALSHALTFLPWLRAVASCLCPFHLSLHPSGGNPVKGEIRSMPFPCSHPSTIAFTIKARLLTLASKPVVSGPQEPLKHWPLLIISSRTGLSLLWTSQAHLHRMTFILAVPLIFPGELPHVSAQLPPPQRGLS